MTTECVSGGGNTLHPHWNCQIYTMFLNATATGWYPSFLFRKCTMVQNRAAAYITILNEGTDIHNSQIEKEKKGNKRKKQQKKRDRERQRETERDRERQRETQRNTERQRETERDRSR